MPHKIPEKEVPLLNDIMQEWRLLVKEYVRGFQKMGICGVKSPGPEEYMDAGSRISNTKWRLTAYRYAQRIYREYIKDGKTMQCDIIKLSEQNFRFKKKVSDGYDVVILFRVPWLDNGQKFGRKIEIPIRIAPAYRGEKYTLENIVQFRLKEPEMVELVFTLPTGGYNEIKHTCHPSKSVMKKLKRRKAA